MGSLLGSKVVVLEDWRYRSLVEMCVIWSIELSITDINQICQGKFDQRIKQNEMKLEDQVINSMVVKALILKSS